MRWYQLMQGNINHQLALLENLNYLIFRIEGGSDFERGGSRCDSSDEDTSVDSIFATGLDEGFQRFYADVQVAVEGDADCAKGRGGFWVSRGGRFGEGFYHFGGGCGGGCE